MVKQNILLLTAAMVIGCMSGCSCDDIGKSPPGKDELEEMREAFNKLPAGPARQTVTGCPVPHGVKRDPDQGLVYRRRHHILTT